MLTVDQLVRQAGELANAGRWLEAEQIWLEVQRQDPGHPKALFALGVHAFEKGDLAKAYELLVAARNAAPRDLFVLLALGRVCRQRALPDLESEAINAALAVDPYFLPGLLVKADWLERFGLPAAAASAYGNALKVAPPESQWPPSLRPQLEHARRVVERHRQAYNAYLQEQLATVQSALPDPLRERWREAISIMAGRSRPYLSDCNQLYVPRLPAIPFYDRAQFSWMAALEEKTDIIRSELLAVLDANRDRFRPYIAYKPGEPVNQWIELNHSTQWSVFHLWRNGKPVNENLEICPQTAKVLAETPLAEIAGLCPNALFSALAPRTHIPPHHGETNARLVAHLPLIVPDGCRLRVGFEERIWEVGKALVFDDTLEHEARNDSDQLRVVLIFDVWNPLLSPAERNIVQSMTTAAKQFAQRPRSDNA